MTKKKQELININYRSGQATPDWVRDVIETHLAIENEDAKSAGEMGFMARALVNATMPYKDPKTDVFKRVNGDFRLRIVAGYEGGIPYGIYPRLLISWLTTEVVRTQSPHVELGESLSAFLRNVLDTNSRSGGARGTANRVQEQMRRLFGAFITAEYGGKSGKQGFQLRNVAIAEALNEAPRFRETLGAALHSGAGDGSPLEPALWTPQDKDKAGAWQSIVMLTPNFFKECVDNPVPIDLRAYRALKGSPLAMDIYTWLTYRMSYTTKRSRPIRWEALMMQFGSNYTTDQDQAIRDFKKAFLKSLKAVSIVYPQAKLEVTETGLILLPSRPHIAPRVLPSQSQLF